MACDAAENGQRAMAGAAQTDQNLGSDAGPQCSGPSYKIVGVKQSRGLSESWEGGEVCFLLVPVSVTDLIPGLYVLLKLFLLLLLQSARCCRITTDCG